MMALFMSTNSYTFWAINNSKLKSLTLAMNTMQQVTLAEPPPMNSYLRTTDGPKCAKPLQAIFRIATLV